MSHFAHFAISNHISTFLLESSFQFYFRLVSCYRDKFEIGSTSDYIFQTFNPKIINDNSRPTFQEFVDYLIRTPIEEYNDHWLPNWIHCQLCSQEYDLIGYMETLDEDVAYIFDLSNIEMEFPWNNHKQNESKIMTQKYFSLLTDEQKQKLYEIYLPDFLMFGYENTDYI